MSQGKNNQPTEQRQRRYSLSKKGYGQVLEDFEQRQQRIDAELLLASIRLVEAIEFRNCGRTESVHLRGLTGLALDTWIRDQTDKVDIYLAAKREIYSKVDRLRAFIRSME